MPDDSQQTDEIKTLMPGEEGEPAAPPPPAPKPRKPRGGAADAPAAEPEPTDVGASESADTDQADDGCAARIAELEAENAQLRATVDLLNEQLLDASAAAGAQIEATPKEPRLIGEDWSTKTSAQAKAAGVEKPVLCSDGYYVPGA